MRFKIFLVSFKARFASFSFCGFEKILTLCAGFNNRSTIEGNMSLSLKLNWERIVYGFMEYKLLHL